MAALLDLSGTRMQTGFSLGQFCLNHNEMQRLLELYAVSRNEQDVIVNDSVSSCQNYASQADQSAIDARASKNAAASSALRAETAATRTDHAAALADQVEQWHNAVNIKYAAIGQAEIRINTAKASAVESAALAIEAANKAAQSQQSVDVELTAAATAAADAVTAEFSEYVDGVKDETTAEITELKDAATDHIDTAKTEATESISSSTEAAASSAVAAGESANTADQHKQEMAAQLVDVAQIVTATVSENVEQIVADAQESLLDKIMASIITNAAQVVRLNHAVVKQGLNQ